MKTLRERFEDKYQVDENGCWIWTAGRHEFGYGRFADGYAHRFSYELHVGPIPDGYEIDHLCRVPPCVNPAHLEPVTHAENLRRGVGIGAQNARKRFCSRGHPYSVENTYRYPDGGRRCRVCAREDQRVLRAKRATA